MEYFDIIYKKLFRIDFDIKIKIWKFILII